MSVTAATLPEPDLDALSAEGEAIYERRLRPVLEPERTGETVAIHLPTGEYALGKSSPAALRALRSLGLDGMVMTRIVGPDRPDTTLDRMLGPHHR